MNKIIDFINTLSDNEKIILSYETEKQIEQIKLKWKLENKEKEKLEIGNYVISINNINKENNKEIVLIDWIKILTSNYFWENHLSLISKEQIKTKHEYHTIKIIEKK